VLFPSMDGHRLCREEGYEELPVREALWKFGSMDRLSSWELRAFAAKARLPGVSLRETNDQRLRQLIRHAIRHGGLMALCLRGWSKAVLRPNGLLNKKP